MVGLTSLFEQEADLQLSPEGQFIEATSRRQRKQRGQFFTPASYANIMVDWIQTASPRTVLDPAVGTGVLINASQRRSVGCAFTGYDIDPLALELAQKRLQGAALYHQDFLASDQGERFDAIIANPPYIIHREYDLDPLIAEHIDQLSGQKFSRQSNLYVYFVVKICEQLNEGGRAAIIIPAEWMSANYGQPLKAYLLNNGLLRELVTIDCAGHAFADNMATASILLIEKDSSVPELLQSHYVPVGKVVTSLTELEHAPDVVHQRLPTDVLRSRKKWDALISRSVAPRAEGSVKLGDLVTTKRGIATGANSFFLLSRDEAEQHGLETGRMDRCIGKTAQVADICFTGTDFDELAEAGQACFLFNPKGNLTPAEADYIRRGECEGIPLKHGPRTKKIWYAAETREAAPIWASTFGRGRMRFVHNAASVKTLTCFHGLYPKGLTVRQIRALAALLNSDMMQHRIADHVRRFASGLMKLEPRDILDIEVPDIRLVPPEIAERLSDWLEGDTSDGNKREEARLDHLAAILLQHFDNLSIRNRE